MKKLFISMTCFILLMIPLVSGTQTPINEQWLEDKIIAPSDYEYDGTFVGGLGQIYKENEEWKYEIHSYIAGVYKENNHKTLYGNIYNLEEEHVGIILMFSNRFFLVGGIQDLDGHKLPICGFIFDRDDNNFIGRIMSVFGPAPYLYGKYMPN